MALEITPHGHPRLPTFNRPHALKAFDTALSPRVHRPVRSVNPA